MKNEVYINVIFIEGDPSIRINSVPVTNRELISDGKWIGSSGKQVRFNKNIPYMKIQLFISPFEYFNIFR